MARPTKYNWEAIKSSYEGGFSKDEIVKKFNITKATLTNKINKDLWVVKSDVNTDIEGLNAKLNAVAQNYSEHPEMEEMFHERLDTSIVDDELKGNNRKIAKLLQSVIVQNKNNINLQNIRNVSGVMKDIEGVANPSSSKIEVNNTNAQQNNKSIKVTYE